MFLLFVKQFFGEELIQALCWTLLHSIWQGLLLAILGGLVIQLTRKSGPVLRYNLLSSLFFLFMLSAGLTFVLEFHSAEAAAVAAPLVLVVRPSTLVMAAGPAADISSGMGQHFMNGLVNYFDDHALLVVAVWGIIFSVRLLKILTNFGTIQRIRHHGTHPVSEYWKERLQELAGLLHIKMRVSLLESELIRVPMVAGLFKPMILIPFSLLSQLPLEQVEAVLLHELAHIRRRDYFVNIIQSCTEILFFFNPGVLWISSLIREERENCCDDIAVGHSGSKKEFIHALVSFQEYNSTGIRPAMAFAGARDHLLQRVKRIVYNDNKKLDLREKFFLLGCLLVTGVLTLAFSYLPQSVASSSKKIADTVVAPKTRIVPAVGTNSVQAVRPGLEVGRTMESVRRLQAAGEAVATTDRQHVRAAGEGLVSAREGRISDGQGAAVINARMDSVPGQEERKEKLRREQAALLERQEKLAEEQERLWEEQKKLKEEEIKLSGSGEAAELAEKQAEMNADMARKMAELAEKQAEMNADMARKMVEQKLKRMQANMQEMEEDRKQMLEFKEKAIRKMEEDQSQMTEDQLKRAQDHIKMTEEERQERKNLIKAQIESRKDMEANIRRMEEDKSRMMEDKRKMLEENMENMKASREDMQENREEMEKDKMKLKEDRKIREKQMGDMRENILNPIISYLYEEKLITDKENISFSLTNEELVVNGVKQPDAVYNTLREKYLKDFKDEIIYSRKNGSESISVNKRK